MYEICGWDWGVIAGITGTLFTTSIAWIISEKWRGQKRTEVVAALAKEVYQEIVKFDRIFSLYIRSHIQNVQIGPKGGNVYYGEEQQLNPIVNDSYVVIVSNLEIILHGHKNIQLEEIRNRFIQSYTEIDQKQQDMLYEAQFSQAKIVQDDEMKNDHVIQIKVKHGMIEDTLTDIKDSLVQYIVYQ